MDNLYLLKQKQALPLKNKEIITAESIKAWYQHWDGRVCVSFSGGKDSTVLLHQVRKLYPDVKAVFVDTGLEYPEIREFVKTIENVDWVKPEMPFKEVIEKYGYPVVSKKIAEKLYNYRITHSDKYREALLHGRPLTKIPYKWRFLIGSPFKISHRCCDIMKKRPLKKIQKEHNLLPFVGLMAEEGQQRQLTYLKYGCNNFDGKSPTSNPLSTWMEQDIWEYIKKYNLPYSTIYDMGYQRTGCMFCMFGLHMGDRPNRFEMMKQTHPKLYKYCMERLGLKEVISYVYKHYIKRMRF